MNKIAIILIITLVSANLFAGTIKGKVTLGLEKAVVPGVTVLLVDKKVRFSTDANGEFTIPNITNGLYTLEISQIGYKRVYLEKIEGVENEVTLVTVNLEESPFLLNEVVVTGTFQKHLFKETPVITEIISSQDLKRSGTSEISEVLRTQTGIELGTGIGQTQNVRLQGLKKNQVLVLVDGERISGKVDDALDINQIPLQTIERIEIVKGPMSSMYGSDAIGGVINIITKDAQPGTTNAEGAVTVGSNGRQDYNFSTTHGMADLFGEQSSLSILLSGGWNKYFGIDYNTKDAFSEMPEYDKKNITLKVKGEVTDRFRFDVKFDIYQDQLEWLAGTDNYWTYTDFADNKKYNLSAGTHYLFGASTMLKVNGSYSTNEHGSSEKNNAGFLVRNNISTEELKNARIQLTVLPYMTSTLTIGLEVSDERVTSLRLTRGQQLLSNNILFAEDEWAIGDFTFNVGGRYSDNSRYGTFFAPRLSALYRPTERLTLRSSYGRGFRSPSLIELFLDLDHSSFGYRAYGNPNLQPEESHGFNIGFDYARDDMLWFRLNGYYNDVTNMIAYYDISRVPTIFSYRNISTATAKGIDLDIDVRMLSPVNFSIGYNYNETKDNNGNLIPFHSPHTINLKVNSEIKVINGSMFLGYRWYDKMPVINEQTDLTGLANPVYYYSPSYSVFNINTVSKVFSTLELSAGINNIFDKTVYPFGQIKGREFFAGLRYQL